MKISVQYQINNKILQLAKLLVKDWVSKIQLQISLARKNQKLENLYKILIINDKHNISKELKLKFDLIIVMLQLQYSPSHLLALSEQLSTFGQNKNQFVPTFLTQITIANCIAICIFQNYLQKFYFLIFQRQTQQYQQKQFAKICKISCIDCLKYYGAFNITSKAIGLINQKRGNNVLDGGAPFYSIYPTKQGLIAIGNLQPKFYQQMIDQLGLSKDEKAFCLENQLNSDSWPKLRNILSKKFLQNTAQNWQKIMSSKDTCITKVQEHQNIDQNYLHPYLIKPKI